MFNLKKDIAQIEVQVGKYDQGKKYVSVHGYHFTLPANDGGQAFELFAHREYPSLKDWTISEPVSGLNFHAYGKTRKQAIDEAGVTLARVGDEFARKTIKKAQDKVEVKPRKTSRFLHNISYQRG